MEQFSVADRRASSRAVVSEGESARTSPLLAYPRGSRQPRFGVGLRADLPPNHPGLSRAPRLDHRAGPLAGSPQALVSPRGPSKIGVNAHAENGLDIFKDEVIERLSTTSIDSK